MVGDAEIISVPLTPGRNAFEIAIFDEKRNSFTCEPTSFSITSPGPTIPDATLPFSLGIEVYDAESNEGLLNVINGLEKGGSLPAKGKVKYKTQKAIRPGVAQDRIRVPIYEGEANTRAILNELTGYVTITGEDLPKFLPKGSEVEITLSVDKSRRITVSMFFPDLDEIILRKLEPSKQGEYNADELENEIKQGKGHINQN